MNKKVINILLSLCAISVLSITAFAQSVGGGEWTVGYKEGDVMYSQYIHNTKPHGVSVQIYDGGSWDTDRICVQSGRVACLERKDDYRHSNYHGHGFWHRCGIDIPDCNGAYGNFD